MRILRKKRMIDLSICIPTYNRSDSCIRLVKEILSIKDRSIEIVVLDNGSQDNTLELLNAIEDKRLCIYANGKNKGALFNMLNVLSKANGRYILYSTDQDFINASNILDFKYFLLNGKNIACGYCELSPSEIDNHNFFMKGYDAVSNIAYLSRHPSGHFFNNSLLKEIDYLSRFSDYNFVDLFPFEFIFAELCMLGNATVYNKQLNIPENTSSTVSKNKSSTTKGSSSKAFFSPTSRLKMALHFSKHASQLKINNSEKIILIKDIFLRGLVSSTLGYKVLLNNESLCKHYYIQPRHISISEIFSIGLNFTKKYFSNADYINQQITNKIYFTLMIIFSLIRKLLKKTFK